MAAPSTFALGIIVKVTITDDSIAEVVELGFDRLVVERSINDGVSWTEVTVEGDRPVLEAAKKVYSWIDRAGNSAYLYRTRYLNTKTGTLSDPSGSISGEGLAIAGLLTVAQLKQRYFHGVDFTDDAGNPLPDSVWEHYILQAVHWFEHQLDIRILPTALVEVQDYWRNENLDFTMIELDEYPVISIEKLYIQHPNPATPVQVPSEWLRIEKPHGLLELVPIGGSIALALGSAFPHRAFYAHLPHYWKVEYTAGFEEGKVPANIIDLIGMFAALGPFNVFGDLIAGAGIATVSLSMDGLSQSIGTTSSATNAGYGSRIIQYLKQIKEQIPLLRRYYKGIRMRVA